MNGRELDIEADEPLEDRVAGELGIPPAGPGRSVPRGAPLRLPTATATAARPPFIESLAFALVALLLGCQGSSPPVAASNNVETYGVDTRDFTPRERREFSTYVKELPAPCRGVTRPDRAVPQRGPAVLGVPPGGPGHRQGGSARRMAREQVEQLYKERFDAASAKTIPLEGSPSRGPENAPVVFVEFADFECPFCQKPRSGPSTSSGRSGKDKLRFVYKFMPLQMHAHSEVAARAAIAAQAQGKFWEMDRMLFSHGQHLEPPDLEGYAKAIGLDLERFRADMASPETKARLVADRQLADDLGVKGTPTIYIDGREYDSKVDLAEWVDQEIAFARKEVIR